MSIVDKLVAAVTPPESEDARLQARAQAHAAANPGDWLAMVLEHHERIEAAFAAVKAATTADAQVAARKRLAIILTGHSNAEETVLYPALAAGGENRYAIAAYSEQAAARIQMGLLEKLDEPQRRAFDQRDSSLTAGKLHQRLRRPPTAFRSRAPA